VAWGAAQPVQQLGQLQWMPCLAAPWARKSSFCLAWHLRPLSAGTMQITSRRLCWEVLFLSGRNVCICALRLCFCQVEVCVSVLVSGGFAFMCQTWCNGQHQNSAPLWSQHAWIMLSSDTRLPILHMFSTHLSSDVALQMARHIPVHVC